MVVSPNRQNREVPRFPITASCGIAIQNGIASKYLILSNLEAHFETNTMAKSFQLCHNALNIVRNGPKCQHDCDPKYTPTTTLPHSTVEVYVVPGRLV
jgi:hypothetical protein